MPLKTPRQSSLKSLATAYALRWVDAGIDQLESSHDPRQALAGRVLAQARHGAALGAMGAMAVVAAGQLLSGQGGAALATALGSALVTNPLALAASAVLALVYGWKGLPRAQKDAILRQLSHWLGVALKVLRDLFRQVLAAVTRPVTPHC